LIETLGEVYLWWREARKYEGFLEEHYANRGLVPEGERRKVHRLVSLVWQIDWSGHEAPKLQKLVRKRCGGARSEFETNKDAYEVEDPSMKS
jgi:hypothetical protein